MDAGIDPEVFVSRVRLMQEPGSYSTMVDATKFETSGLLMR